MIKPCLVAICATFCTSGAFALTPSDVKVITEAAKEICVVPDRYGDIVQAEGQVTAGLAVPVKIVKGDVSGKLSYEHWKGIPITADKYKDSPRICALEVTKLFVTGWGPSVTPEVAKVVKEPAEKLASNTSLCGTMTVTQVQKQKGYDGTYYIGYFDFTGGQEQLDNRACGREIWFTQDKTHPSYGTKFVYLVDGQKKRVSEQLYTQARDGSLQTD